ncbi:MAG: hypothetical protein PHQ65_16085 [Bacteroidales bacterium]|nr:hypothetical protein [Bacteroidales bacterium]
MKNAPLFLITLLVALAACSEKSEEVNPQPVAPFSLTLQISEQYLAPNDSLWFMVSAPDGSFLDGRWQKGPGTLTFAAPSGTTWPEQVTFTYGSFYLWNNIRLPRLQSIFQIPAGVYALEYDNYPSSQLVEVEMIHVPPLHPYKWSLISNRNSSSRFQYLSSGSTRNLSGSTAAKECYAKIVTESGEPRYTYTTDLPASGSYTLDLSNTLPLQTKTIASSLLPSYIQLYAIPGYASGDYASFLIDYTNNESSVSYPDGVASHFATYWSAEDATAGCEFMGYSIGAIPDALVPFNGHINIVSTAYPQLSWQKAGDFDVVSTFWSYVVTHQMGSASVWWSSRAPGAVTSLVMPLMPPAVAAQLGLDVNLFDWVTVSGFDYDDPFVYSDHVKRIFSALNSDKPRGYKGVRTSMELTSSGLVPQPEVFLPSSPWFHFE